MCNGELSLLIKVIRLLEADLEVGTLYIIILTLRTHKLKFIRILFCITKLCNLIIIYCFSKSKTTSSPNLYFKILSFIELDIYYFH